VLAQPTNGVVRQDVQTIDEIESLENHRAARSPSPQLAPLQSTARNVSAVDRTLPGVGQAVDRPQQCRFACPRTAKDIDHLPGWEGDGYLVHGYD
jgi:hypothetical protein